MLMSAGNPPEAIIISEDKFLIDCYEAIGCTSIETITLDTTVGRALIVCDDEALLKDHVPLPSIAVADRGQFIYGKCLVFGYDESCPSDPFKDVPKRMQRYLSSSPVLVV